MSHTIVIYGGAEYEGETYIRCSDCGVTFDEGDDQYGGLQALQTWFREHGYALLLAEDVPS